MSIKQHIPAVLGRRQERWRVRAPLLAILALVLSSLACITSELQLVVKYEEGQVDTLDVQFQRYMLESYVSVAKSINQERAADFAAAGRSTDTKDLLPVTREDFGDLLNPQIYEDKGYSVSSSERGFSATQSLTLDKDRSAEDWSVQIIHNPDHPEQITYRAKIHLDLTDMEDSIFQLRSQPLPNKPNLNPGSASGLSGSSFGDAFNLFGGMSEELEQEMTIEMWYIQKALQESDPIEFTFSIELPGTVVLHQVDGQTAGTLEGNRVTLLLDEAALMANAGKKLVFHVESIRKDCRLACDPEKHQVWDGKDDGVSCNCTCDKGYTMVEGTTECTNCKTFCEYPERDLVLDLDKCEINKCACKCKEGMKMNWAGTECVDEKQSWLENNHIGEGGPTTAQMMAAIEAILDPENQNNINEMAGWNFLTSTEREQLLQYLGSLGHAVDRTQLTVYTGPDMTTDERYQRIKEKENRLKEIRRRAIEKAEREYRERQNVHKVIIKEIGGSWEFGQHILKIPEYIEMIFKTPKELAVEYVEGKITDKVKERIEKEALDTNPRTIEAAALELVKQIPYLATKGTVNDYFNYKDLFEDKCGEGCQGENAVKAHYEAMEEMRKMIDKSGRLDWAKEGEVYDHAFRTLNDKLDPLKENQ